MSKENAELESNLYCNLGTSSIQIGSLKKGKKYIKQAVGIRERYHLPFNQNALIQEIYFAILIAVDGKPKEAIMRISELITVVDESPYPMESSLGQLYLVLGLLKQNFVSLSSKRDDLKKAELYLKNTLQPEHPLLMQAQYLFDLGNLRIIEHT